MLKKHQRNKRNLNPRKRLRIVDLLPRDGMIKQKNNQRVLMKPKAMVSLKLDGMTKEVNTQRETILICLELPFSVQKLLDLR